MSGAIDDRTSVAPASVGRSQVLAVLASIMLPVFLAVVDQTIVSTALPSMAATLGGVERVSWVVVAYLIATTIAAPIYGQMRDIYGGRRLMIIALVVFMSASLVCAVSTSMEMLAVARVLQGLGGGGLMTLSQARIGEAIPPRDRARYQGYIAAVIVTSSTLGPIIGGVLTHTFGWRSIFLINLPLGLIALAQVLRLPKAAFPAKSPAFDHAGLACFVIFIVSLLFTLELCRQPAALNAIAVIGLGMVAVTSAVLLMRIERRAAAPLFPLALFARAEILRSDLLAACHGAALVSLVTILPLYFHVFTASTAADTGLVLLPLLVGVGTGSMLTGRLVSSSGRTTIFPSYGLIVTTVLMVVLALEIGSLRGLPLGALLFCLGLSMGTVMGVVQITVQCAAGPGMLGSAAASVQLSRSLGAAVGTAFTGMILFIMLAMSDANATQIFVVLVQKGAAAIPNFYRLPVHGEIVRAFQAAFLTIAVFTAMGCAIAWSIPARHLASERIEPPDIATS